MDTVFTSLSAAAVNILCVRTGFPAGRAPKSGQIQGPDGLPWSLILHPLPTGYTPASDVTSQPSRLGDRPGITFVKFANDLFA